MTHAPDCSVQRRVAARLACALAALGLVTTSPADIIYQTHDPFGSPFGLWGPDVSSDQSVGLRFTPAADYELTRISLWFMNNSGTQHPLVKVTLRNDHSSGGQSVPGAVIYESLSFNVTALGWDPQLEVLTSQVRPWLTAGVHYWIVCDSQAQGGEDGVWNYAALDSGFSAIRCCGPAAPWQAGHDGAVPAGIVEGVCRVPGDANGDRVVDQDDLDLALFNFGQTVPPRTNGDADGDGDVDQDDLDLVLFNFGQTCGDA